MPEDDPSDEDEQSYYEGLNDFLEGTELCSQCEGTGYVHNCGEDTCCCAHPEETDLETCAECDGNGHL